MRIKYLAQGQSILMKLRIEPLIYVSRNRLPTLPTIMSYVFVSVSIDTTLILQYSDGPVRIFHSCMEPMYFAFDLIC